MVDDMAGNICLALTSGKAKGVMLSQDMVCRHTVGTIAEMRLHSADVWLHAAPMFHLVDAFAIYAITAVGGTHVLQPAFDVSATLWLMQQEGVTISNMVGTRTHSRHVMDTHFDPSFLRSTGILLRGEQSMSGPRLATSSNAFAPSFLT